MSDVEYFDTVTKLNGERIPKNACYYCASTDGPFVEWGSAPFLKCKGGCP